MGKEPIIELKNLNFWYNRGMSSETRALNNVSLTINRGEYVAFFGPSGSGKTTLLYILAGIDKPTDGAVVIKGRNIVNFSKNELAVYRQLGVGIVFQQFNLIPSLNIIENVALPMTFLGVNPKRRREEAMHLLERLGIQSLASRYPFELSGGQQQRVGIARALANNPPIIIADEPLGNLDSDNAKTVLAFLEELNKKDGRTIIMVTHEAWSLSDVDKIFHIKDGTLDKVEEIISLSKLDAVLDKGIVREGIKEKESSEDLVAYSVANVMMRGFSLDEIKRFELYLKQRLRNEISAEEFFQILDRPYREGGVGLWKQKARRLGNYVEEITSKKKEVSQIVDQLSRNPETPLVAEVEKIRYWVLKEYNGQLNSLQIIRLDEVIRERLQSIISRDHFRQVVSLPKSKYGVGLSLRTTQHIVDRMESILDENGISPAVAVAA